MTIRLRNSSIEQNMKVKYRFHLKWFVVFASLLFSSCSKHDDVVPAPVFNASHINWTEIDASFGGNINSMASVGNRLFAGSKNGIYISSDNGGSWAKSSLHRAVESLAVIGNTIISACIDTVYVSADNGNTWSKAKWDGHSAIFSVTALGNYLYGSSGVGAYVSSDNGSNWNYPANSGILSGSTLECFATNGSTVFAGGTGGVYATTNNAVSWTPVNVGLTGRYVFSLMASNGILFAGTDSGIYTSTNNGLSWAAVASASAPTNMVQFLTFSGNSIYAGSQNAVYATSDLGVNWSMSNGFNSSVTSVWANGGTVLAATDREGIFTSTNTTGTYSNGVSYILYEQVGKGIHDPIALFVGTVGNKIFMGANTGMFSSSDDGVTWSGGMNQPGSINSYAMDLISKGNTLYAAASGGVFQSTDNGNTWKIPTSNYYFQATGIRSIGNTLFAAGGTNVYKSTDNGGTWNAVNIGAPVGTQITKLTTIGGKLCVGTQLGIYLSSDGTNWSWMNETIDFHDFYVNDVAASGNDIYVASSIGLYTTSNTGTTWTNLSSVKAMCVAIDGGNIVVGTNGQGAFLSTDKGKTWSAISNGLTDFELYCYDVSIIGNKIYLATNAGLFTSPF